MVGALRVWSTIRSVPELRGIWLYHGMPAILMVVAGGLSADLVRQNMGTASGNAGGGGISRKPRASEREVKVKDPSKTSMFSDMLRQVRRVPRGKVATYGDIAYAAGYPGAARQVAWALHAESAGTATGTGQPTALRSLKPVPWHRIVGAGGTILLTGEHGFEQRMHLQAEGVSFLGLKVNMAIHHHRFFRRKLKKRNRDAKRNPRAESRTIYLPDNRPEARLIVQSILAKH